MSFITLRPWLQKKRKRRRTGCRSRISGPGSENEIAWMRKIQKKPKNVISLIYDVIILAVPSVTDERHWWINVYYGGS